MMPSTTRQTAVWCALLGLCLLALAPGRGQAAAIITKGELHVGGARVFLKTAVPLANFASEDLRSTVDVLLGKGYNNFKINLYWDHFDQNGDGVLDKPLTKLNQLISHITAKKAHWALSFETYNVGGGGVPTAFFTKNPAAQAVNSKGQKVFDTEYKTNKPVPSIFHAAYLKASRDFIINVLKGVNSKGALYFETTVEPQYIGNQALDYSAAAQAAYKSHCAGKGLPYSWPPAESSAQWNTFRATALAGWINGDIQAIRSVAGAGALVAVDYLETGGADMQRRNGGSATFLGALSGVSIIQCNWHWKPGTNTPFDGAYNLASSLAGAKGWGISEHMTINGNDFTKADISKVLQHTLSKGNKIGWEVVNTRPSTSDPFTTYNSDWSPKAVVAPLDNNHASWMSKAYGGGGVAYAGAYVSQQYPAKMESGKQYKVSVDLQNIGTATWSATTRLGTTVPQDRASAFYTPGSWLSPNRPAAAAATSTGGVSRFSFVMTAPVVTAAKNYTEHWGLVQDGVQWFKTPPQTQIWFAVTVLPKGQQPDSAAAPPDAAITDTGAPAKDSSGAPADSGQQPDTPTVPGDFGAADIQAGETPADSRGVEGAPGPDHGGDPAGSSSPQGGCACRVEANAEAGPAALVVVLALLLLRRRRPPGPPQP